MCLFVSANAGKMNVVYTLFLNDPWENLDFVWFILLFLKSAKFQSCSIDPSLYYTVLVHWKYFFFNTERISLFSWCNFLSVSGERKKKHLKL